PARRGRHAAHRPETRRRVRWSLTTWHVRVIMAVTAAAVVLIAGRDVMTHPAIKTAGGAKPKADTTALNLARELNDGEQILVGVDQPAGDPGGGDTADAGQSGRRVNVNTASSEELQTLPGVGPATAQAIIDFR